MKRHTKIWYGLGISLCVGTAMTQSVKPKLARTLNPLSEAFAQSGESGEGGQAENINGFRGDLNLALEKIFMGEGGEGGTGLSHMWPSVSAPALSDKQLQQVIPGNTLRSNDRLAYYFSSSGSLSGWTNDWEKLPQAEGGVCPAQEVPGDAYFREEELCWRKVTHEVNGDWSIHDHKLCMDYSLQGKAQSECWHVVLLLDQFAFFGNDGQISGTGKKLRKGEVLEQYTP